MSKLQLVIPLSLGTRRLPKAAAIVAMVLFASSCHDRMTLDNRISVNGSSSGTTISVAPGDEIDITLQTIGPGQYETPTVSSGSIRFLGEGDAGLQNPGGVKQLFRFEAVTAGRAEITISHTESPLPTPPFTIVVEVN